MQVSLNNYARVFKFWERRRKKKDFSTDPAVGPEAY
jgi:hypothetical protein